MVKQLEKTSDKRPGKRPGKKSPTHQPLVQIFGGDFHRNADGSWVATKEIVINGAAETQLLIPEGRQFKKGEVMIFGLDLAAVLERHCRQ